MSDRMPRYGERGYRSRYPVTGGTSGRPVSRWWLWVYLVPVGAFVAWANWPALVGFIRWIGI